MSWYLRGNSKGNWVVYFWGYRLLLRLKADPYLTEIVAVLYHVDFV